MTINDPQNTTQNATDHEQHKTLHRMLPITSNTKHYTECYRSRATQNTTQNATDHEQHKTHLQPG
jgi:hypothetical protein